LGGHRIAKRACEDFALAHPHAEHNCLGIRLLSAGFDDGARSVWIQVQVLVWDILAHCDLLPNKGQEQPEEQRQPIVIAGRQIGELQTACMFRPFDYPVSFPLNIEAERGRTARPTRPCRWLKTYIDY
jgi:hypothetical protein